MLARAGRICVFGVTYDPVRKILPLSFAVPNQMKSGCVPEIDAVSASGRPSDARQRDARLCGSDVTACSPPSRSRASALILWATSFETAAMRIVLLLFGPHHARWLGRAIAPGNGVPRVIGQVSENRSRNSPTDDRSIPSNVFGFNLAGVARRARHLHLRGPRTLRPRLQIGRRPLSPLNPTTGSPEYDGLSLPGFFDCRHR